MTVVAIGLNHHTAPEAMLEMVSLAGDQLPKALAEVGTSEVVSEAVVLSTCNRTEFYVRAERFHEGFRDVRRTLGLLSGVDPDQFDPFLYTHYHADAIRHLFTVTAGLDSLVLGEHEILGQVTRAWEAARREEATGPVLNLLFQRAIEGGKKVRTDTDIGRNTASVSHAALALLAEHHPGIDGSSVMLVGAGEVGTGVANAMTRKYEIELVVANRTQARAEALALDLGARVVPFEAATGALATVDILISATGAPDPIVTTGELTAATAGGRALHVLDLAQPRDLPPEAATVPGVELLDLGAVQSFANRGIEARRTHVEAARRVVDAEIERYQAAASARQVAPLIGDLHQWADGVREHELERYAARLARMSPEDRQAVESLSRSLTNKFLHPPTVTLKDAAGTARGERLADAVRELFDRS